MSNYKYGCCGVCGSTKSRVFYTFGYDEWRCPRCHYFNLKRKKRLSQIVTKIIWFLLRK